MDDHQSTVTPVQLTLRVSEFGIPPVKDGLVIGKKAAIGNVAMKKALPLLHPASFEHLKVQDEVVGAIFVRSNILLRVSRKQIQDMVLRSVKPLMNEYEIMHLTIQAEVTVEDYP